MNGRLMIEGNAFYEVDDECIKCKREAQELKEQKKEKEQVNKNKLK